MAIETPMTSLPNHRTAPRRGLAECRAMVSVCFLRWFSKSELSLIGQTEPNSSGPVTRQILVFPLGTGFKLQAAMYSPT